MLVVDSCKALRHTTSFPPYYTAPFPPPPATPYTLSALPHRLPSASARSAPRAYFVGESASLSLLCCLAKSPRASLVRRQPPLSAHGYSRHASKASPLSSASQSPS